MNIKPIFNGGQPGIWYTIPGTDVKVLIKNMKPMRHDELRENSMKAEFNGSGMQRVMDSDKLMDLILDEVVKDWKNIFEDDKPFPCNTENKIELDKNWAPFRKLWYSVFVGGSAIEAAIQETEIKN